MSKKLLIVTPIYPPTIGGPAFYTQSLVAKLPKDIAAKVITLGSSSSESAKLIKIANRQNAIARQWQLFKTIYQNLAWADSVYVQGTLTVGLASMLACKLKRMTYVLKCVGDEVWESYRAGGGNLNLDRFLEEEKSLPKKVMLYLEKLILKNARQVIVPGDFLQSLIRRYFKLEAVNIANAVDFNNSKSDIKIPRSIVYIGRLVPWKQLDQVLEAFALLNKDRESLWQLSIIGEGSQKHSLEKQVLDKKITGVKFLGSLDRTKTLDYLMTQEYLVLYSSYEGMSHTLLDAMASNTKIVASSIEANSKVLARGEYGRLVPLGRPDLLSLAFTQPYDMVMLKKARAHVMAEYSWDRHLNKLLKIIFP